MARPAPPSLAFQDDTALMGPDQAALLDRIKRSGGRDIRMNVIYGKLRQQGWQPYDQLVNAARARGLHVQATLMSTPQYAPTLDQTLAWNRNDPSQWQAFTNEVAKHLRGRVKRYSVGNEMQFDTFLGGAGDPANAKQARGAGKAYRNIWRGGLAGIKSADPSAAVMPAEMTSTANAREWLKGFLGGKPIRAAGFAFHPYDQPNPQATNTWDIDTLKDLQATLGRYKRQGKLQTARGKQTPLYLTEMGYFADRASVGKRAAMMARAYRLARDAGAKQFLSYQMLPTERKTVTDPATADAYGNMMGGGSRKDPNWVWDTSLDPGALANALRPRKASARAAKVRKKRG